MKSAHAKRRKLLALAVAAFIFPGRVFSKGGPNDQERTEVRIQLTFARNTMIATLYDNPSARDFASMLPLDLKITDFSSNEKIAYLPRKLTVEGHGPFDNERPYDLCYYMPWGILRCSTPTTSIPVWSGWDASNKAMKRCISPGNFHCVSNASNPPLETSHDQRN